MHLFMKKVTLILLLLPFLSFNSDSLLNRPMPLLANKTLDGKTIDNNYFKGHITIVSFMFIGCMPCMNEIGLLNKLNREYHTNSGLQILCIARQMKEQMLQFNSDSKTMFSQLRKALNVDTITYSIQPACSNEKSNMDSMGNNVSLKSECNTISDIYGVYRYPTIFFVDREGIIRKIYIGGPPAKNDTAYYNKLKIEIDSLLGH